MAHFVADVPAVASERVPTVLVVDDDEATRTLFTLSLEGVGWRTLTATNGNEALAALVAEHIDVVLLDSQMPELDGHGTLQAIRADPATSAVSVLFVTASSQLPERLRGLDAGADDFLVKPLDPDELVARVRAHLRGRDAWRRHLQQRLGTRSAVAQALGRIPLDAPPEECARAVCVAIDGLGEGSASAVVGFGPDGDATVLAGTGAFAGRDGARLARPVATRLERLAAAGPWSEHRGSQPAGAIGVPFAAPDVVATAFIPLLGDARILGVLALADQRAQQHGDTAACLSAGIDLAPLVAALLRPLLASSAREQADRAALRARIDRRAFRSVFQPIIDLAAERVVGYEALTRFDDGNPPEQVFAAAAALGVGPELEAVTATRALAEGADLPSGTWLSVNLSPLFLTDRQRMAEVFAPSRLDIVLELTEHDPIDDYDSVLESLAMLDGTRTRLSVDDAGAGYACLHHILQLRPAFVKLDRGWVSGIEEDPARQALVAGLGTFADRTGGRLIAEGIETEAELRTLADLGVPLGQGWLLGRPAAVGAITGD
jgi:EAL domain-containing protein (putative c-di-GMP-specific phosphodiesterase class I)/CheY-like chemotaxis protein